MFAHFYFTRNQEQVFPEHCLIFIHKTFHTKLAMFFPNQEYCKLNGIKAQIFCQCHENKKNNLLDILESDIQAYCLKSLKIGQICEP